MNQDLFSVKRHPKHPIWEVSYYSLRALEEQGIPFKRCPIPFRVLIENALRNFDGLRVTEENVHTYLNWKPEKSDKDVPFMPARSCSKILRSPVWLTWRPCVQKLGAKEKMFRK